MSVFFNTTEAIVYQGNCLEELKNLDDNSVDAVVTDPPYGLSNIDVNVFTSAIVKWAEGDRAFMPSGKGFMNKSWDAFVPPPAVWDECFRVLKPGGHILVFAGSRTVDLMGISIRMAGFEIRDSIAWIYGSGFPKSYNVAKGIESVLTNGSASWNDFHTLNGTLEEANGNANGMVKKNAEQGARPTEYESHGKLTLDPTTEEAKKWQGWGTALKPAIEPIIMARKPLGEKNVASNVLKHGTGAINIDASRIGEDVRTSTVVENGFGSNFMDDNWVPSGKSYEKTVTGRWPTNVIFGHTEDCVQVGETTEKTLNHNAPTGTFAGGEQDRGSDTSEYRENTVVTPVYECVDGCPVKELDKQTGKTKSGKPRADRGTGGIWKEGDGVPVGPQYGDEGGASRFFYQAKASKKDRNEGLEGLEASSSGYSTRYCVECGKNVPYVGSCGCDAGVEMRPANPQQNIHPTVKPTALMEYLIKLVTPVGGTVLDPFTGSGSTGKAAIRNGFNFVGVEMTEEYLPIIQARLEYEIDQKGLF
jgi:site-specific DNA-methyltransferase (adenine-specific)